MSSFAVKKMPCYLSPFTNEKQYCQVSAMLVKPSLPSLLFCPSQLIFPHIAAQPFIPSAPSPSSPRVLLSTPQLINPSFPHFSACNPFFPVSPNISSPTDLPHSVTLIPPHHIIPLAPHYSFFRSLTLASLLLFIASPHVLVLSTS